MNWSHKLRIFVSESEEDKQGRIESSCQPLTWIVKIEKAIFYL